MLRRFGVSGLRRKILRPHREETRARRSERPAVPRYDHGLTMRILVMGLPGAGKTTLAKELASKIPAVHFDADEVREHLGDPGFSHEGRIIQARRMAWLCSIAERAGHPAVASFVCPTEETRAAFGATYTGYPKAGTPTRMHCSVPLEIQIIGWMLKSP
jgi:adenylylsulfate kinase-like enzyme